MEREEQKCEDNEWDEKTRYEASNNPIILIACGHPFTKCGYVDRLFNVVIEQTPSETTLTSSESECSLPTPSPLLCSWGRVNGKGIRHLLAPVSCQAVKGSGRLLGLSGLYGLTSVFVLLLKTKYPINIYSVLRSWYTFVQEYSSA